MWLVELCVLCDIYDCQLQPRQANGTVGGGGTPRPGGVPATGRMGDRRSRTWVWWLMGSLVTWRTGWLWLLWEHFGRARAHWEHAGETQRVACEFLHTSACSEPGNYEKFGCRAESVTCSTNRLTLALDAAASVATPWRYRDYRLLILGVSLTALLVVLIFVSKWCRRMPMIVVHAPSPGEVARHRFAPLHGVGWHEAVDVHHANPANQPIGGPLPGGARLRPLALGGGDDFRGDPV